MPGRDVDWDEARGARPRRPSACRSPPPIRSTSSTPRAPPGIPKGVVRDNGGHAVALKWSMGAVYGMGAGRGVLGRLRHRLGGRPLLHRLRAAAARAAPRSSTRASRSARPIPGAFWRVCAQHGVNALFTAPTAFRAIKKEDPEGRAHGAVRPLALPHALPRRRALRSRHAALGARAARGAGDRSLVADRDRLADGRELRRASACCRSSRARRPSRCRATTSACWARTTRRCRAGQIGSIAIKLPLPPGCLPTLWNNDAGFEQLVPRRGIPATTSPATRAIKDEDGYLYIMSRVDDIINVAGHRLSTGAMEEVLSAHPDVAECAVIGVADEIKGEVPVGFVVTKAGVARADGEIVAASWSSWCASRSGRWPRSRRRGREARCPRRARARSCAAR